VAQSEIACKAVLIDFSTISNKNLHSPTLNSEFAFSFTALSGPGYSDSFAWIDPMHLKTEKGKT